MQLYQMHNEDINDVMSMAMTATLSALTNEGLLTDEQATEFRATHVCLKVDNQSIWRWIKKKFSLNDEENAYYSIVFKVPEAKKDE